MKLKNAAKMTAYGVGITALAAVAVPAALAAYAYGRTAGLATKTIRWAYDNPIKTIAGATAAAGLYYGANNINWDSLEEKVSEKSSQIIEEYHKEKLTRMEDYYLEKTEKLEETITILDDYTRQVERQNNLLREGGAVIYEQYDPLLLAGIGLGSAGIGAGSAYLLRRRKKKPTDIEML